MYLFYASDGDNAASDAGAARAALMSLAAEASFCGYIEVAAGVSTRRESETGRLFAELAAAGGAADSCALVQFEDVWDAIRRFFGPRSPAGALP